MSMDTCLMSLNSHLFDSIIYVLSNSVVWEDMFNSGPMQKVMAGSQV